MYDALDLFRSGVLLWCVWQWDSLQRGAGACCLHVG